MKIAIIGAGITGLACALECERLGAAADVFERDRSIGWIWPSVNFWPHGFYRDTGDIRTRMKNEYGIDIKPLNECKKIIVKSKNRGMVLEGDQGYFIARGKSTESLENQLLLELKKTAIHFNTSADYKELSGKYDWVVVAGGDDKVGRELGVWQDEGAVHIIGGIALGKFDTDTSNIFFNTEYAGTGYARVTPFSENQAIIKLYIIGRGECDREMLFKRFLQQENLRHLEFLYYIMPPLFVTGRVSKFKEGNILLAGRAAGLTERLLGVAAPEDIASGIFAARSIIQGQNYENLIRPLQEHVETLSSIRKFIDGLDNDGFDKLIATMDLPGLKQLIYQTPINFMQLFGHVMERFSEKGR